MFKEKLDLPNTEEQANQILSLPINEFLTKNHKVVHVHANNNGFPVFYLNKNGRISMMFNLLELTLLRSDVCEFSPNNTAYPTELDVPCNKSKPEWELNFYPFLCTSVSQDRSVL